MVEQETRERNRPRIGAGDRGARGVQARAGRSVDRNETVQPPPLPSPAEAPASGSEIGRPPSVATA